MEPDRHPRQRSLSPQRVHTPPGFRLSPFFAPPGWQPPPPRPDRAVILQIDLRPMQHLALLDNYYDILAPQVYTDRGLQIRIYSLQDHLPQLRLSTLRPRTL